MEKAFSNAPCYCILVAFHLKYWRADCNIDVAFIPSDLGDEQVQAALAELEIASQRAMEIGGWKTSSQNVAIAFIPFPPLQVAELLEPSRS